MTRDSASLLLRSFADKRNVISFACLPDASRTITIVLATPILILEKKGKIAFNSKENWYFGAVVSRHISFYFSIFLRVVTVVKHRGNCLTSKACHVAFYRKMKKKASLKFSEEKFSFPENLLKRAKRGRIISKKFKLLLTIQSREFEEAREEKVKLETRKIKLISTSGKSLECAGGLKTKIC